MKFPKKLYVKMEQEGDGETYYIAHVAVNKIVQSGEQVRVAMYELKETMTATGNVTVTGNVTAKR